jgi:nitrogen fixation NifU-like protein
MAYSEKVLDHYENPRNVGVLEDDQSVGIQDAKFKTYGCGSAIASSSLVTEWVKGKSLDEAAEIKNTQIAQELALPPVKIHCSVLAEDAIAAAIDNYREKNQ